MTCPATERYRLHMSQEEKDSIVWYFPFPKRHNDENWKKILNKRIETKPKTTYSSTPLNPRWAWTDGSAIQYSKTNDAGYA